MNNANWLKTFSIGFSIISFGITIAIVGYIVLTTRQNQNVAQPSPASTIDETADWKIYTNRQLNFQFKYPPDYELEKEDQDKVVFSSRFNPGNQKVSSSFTVSWRNVTDVKTIQKCIWSESKSGLPYTCVSGDTQSHLINGVEVVQYSTLSGEGETQALSEIFAQFQTTPKIQFRHYVYAGGISRKFDQILSTFQFTN